MTNYASTQHGATGPSATPMDAGTGKTHGSFCLKVVGYGGFQSAGVQVALETSPDGITWTQAGLVTQVGGGVVARSDQRARFARSNVINLGVGGLPVAAVITSGP
jgi:hypothetical protein